VLELYDDREFIKRFRLDRQGIIFVTDLVRNSTSPTVRDNNCRNESYNDSAFPWTSLVFFFASIIYQFSNLSFLYILYSCECNF